MRRASRCCVPQALLWIALPHELAWDGRDARGACVNPGVYLALLETPAGRAITRVCRLE